MRILGIDPGPEHSGIVLINMTTMRVEKANSEAPNDIARGLIMDYNPDHVAIEMIHNQGRTTVGQTTFDTCVWVGRFLEHARQRRIKAQAILRSEVKMAICGDPRAKDANIAQALRDRIGCKGTAKQPGPTYGVAGHAWQALAVAVTLADVLGGRHVIRRAA